MDPDFEHFAEGSFFVPFSPVPRIGLKGEFDRFMSQLCLNPTVQWPIICLLNHYVWSSNLITWSHVQEVVHVLLTYATMRYYLIGLKEG